MMNWWRIQHKPIAPILKPNPCFWRTATAGRALLRIPIPRHVFGFCLRVTGVRGLLRVRVTRSRRCSVSGIVTGPAVKRPGADKIFGAHGGLAVGGDSPSAFVDFLNCTSGLIFAFMPIRFREGSNQIDFDSTGWAAFVMRRLRACLKTLIAGAEVTRLQIHWKSPGLAVEEVDLLTSAPPFQTRSENLAHKFRSDNIQHEAQNIHR